MITYDFASEWLNKLKEYWFNKDIDRATQLFIKKHHFKNLIQLLKK
jgi:hypothetical protein